MTIIPNGKVNLLPSYNLIRSGKVTAKLVNAGLGWFLRTPDGKEYHVDTIREAVLFWDSLEVA
jgi:hypothetical protein